MGGRYGSLSESLTPQGGTTTVSCQVSGYGVQSTPYPYPNIEGGQVCYGHQPPAQEHGTRRPCRGRDLPHQVPDRQRMHRQRHRRKVLGLLVSTAVASKQQTGTAIAQLPRAATWWCTRRQSRPTLLSPRRGGAGDRSLGTFAPRLRICRLQAA